MNIPEGSVQKNGDGASKNSGEKLKRKTDETRETQRKIRRKTE